MSNVYKDLRDRFSSMIVIVWPIALIGAILSSYIMWQDIQSTAKAYDQIPTYEIDSVYTGMVVAILLWAAQIVFGYIYLLDTSKIWARQISLLCATLDVMTDCWFKMGGQFNLALFPWALALSVGIFCFTSEVLFVVFAGFIANTLGDFLAAASIIVGKIVGGMMMLAGIDETDEGKKHSSAGSGLRR